jgi:peptidoglycan/LPS O-acetylase OafA/YrhL
VDYRREIDGLRALAVLPVILFHAGFQLFSGGFVGVDVFFVISGYLITTIILSEMEQGTFSLVNFYERRARRILPALFLVMLVALPFAWLWLTPAHLKDFSQSLIGVSTFSSNILFWQESGYWGVAAELKPLLHTWSLAVEEQYYVLFPLYLMFMWRFRKRWILSSLIVFATVSLLTAQWGAHKHPSATFFLLTTRVWELVIGACIAFYFLYRKRTIRTLLSHKSIDEILSLIGLLMIVYAVFAYDQTVPYPGVYALVPTVGTGLIILFSSQQTLVGRLLGTKILVSLGLISYSAYLWHQPMFAFARHRSIAEPGTMLYIGIAALSVMLAYISWRYVEKPFRTKGVFSRKKIFMFAVTGSALFILLGFTGHFRDGFESRFKVPASVANSFVRSQRAENCFDFDNIDVVRNWKCEIGDSASNTASYFIVGDSHSLALFDVLDKTGKRHGVKGYFSGVSGCTPFLNVFALRPDQVLYDCHNFNKRVYEFVESNEIDFLILVARWTYYTDGGYDGKNFSYIGLSEDSEKSKAVSRAAFAEGLRETVAAYTRIGVKVSVVRQMPQQLFDPQDIYHRAYMEKDPQGALDYFSVSAERHDLLQEYVDTLFNQTTGNYDLWSYDDLASDLCARKCVIGTADESYYFDDDHLSIAGTHQIERKAHELFARQFDQE